MSFNSMQPNKNLQTPLEAKGLNWQGMKEVSRAEKLETKTKLLVFLNFSLKSKSMTKEFGELLKQLFLRLQFTHFHACRRKQDRKAIKIKFRSTQKPPKTNFFLVLVYLSFYLIELCFFLLFAPLMAKFPSFP